VRMHASARRRSIVIMTRQLTPVTPPPPLGEAFALPDGC
jgi:hypothetical protein